MRLCSVSFTQSKLMANSCSFWPSPALLSTWSTYSSLEATDTLTDTHMDTAMGNHMDIHTNTAMHIATVTAMDTLMDTVTVMHMKKV